MSQNSDLLAKRYLNLRKVDTIPTRDAICEEAGISTAVFYNLLRGTTEITKPLIKVFEAEFEKVEKRYFKKSVNNKSAKA